MGLYSHTHPTALAGPDAARRFYEAMGCKQVSVGELHPSTPVELDLIVGAMPAATGMMDTINFLGGAMTDATWEPLAALANTGCGYLDTRTARANLRVWPERTWVHAPLPDGGLEEASAMFGVALSPGCKVATGEVSVQVTDGHYRLGLEAPRAALVFDTYRRLAGTQHDRGHVSKVTLAAVAPLRAFLHALGARVEAGLTLDLADAHRLVSRLAHPRSKWWGDEVGIEFPGGAITGYTKIYQGQPPVDAWFAKVGEALKTAGLG